MADIPNLTIELPINSSGDIAFNFMEAYIKELEAEGVKELETYLKTTGLEKYQLTDDERLLVNDFRTTGIVSYGVFKFKEIFDHIVQGRRLKKDDQVPGTLPFVMSGTTNTGVVDYIGNDVRLFPKNSLTIDIFGNVFYRNYEYGMGDDTGAYWNESSEIPRKALLYLCTTIEKSLKDQYDYGHKLRSSRTSDFEISLPITDSGKPDYALMEHYIEALQKMAIKNVVLWKNKQIEVTNHTANDN